MAKKRTRSKKLETEERVGEEEDESLPEGLEYQGGRRKRGGIEGRMEDTTLRQTGEVGERAYGIRKEKKMSRIPSSYKNVRNY